MSIINTIMKAVADGYVYETGEYILTTDSNSMTISFANIHPKRPTLIALIDTYYQTHSAPSTQRAYAWGFEDWSEFAGARSSTPKYGAGLSSTGYVSGSTLTTYMRQSAIDSEANLDNYATRTEFYPQASYRFVAGHTFKWIAIWL